MQLQQIKMQQLLQRHRNQPINQIMAKVKQIKLLEETQQPVRKKKHRVLLLQQQELAVHIKVKSLRE